MYITEKNNSNGNDDNNNTYKTLMVMMIIIIHIKHQQQKIRRLMTITIYCTINIIIIIRSVLTIIIMINFFKLVMAIHEGLSGVQFSL